MSYQPQSQNPYGQNPYGQDPYGAPPSYEPSYEGGYAPQQVTMHAAPQAQYAPQYPDMNQQHQDEFHSVVQSDQPFVDSSQPPSDGKLNYSSSNVAGNSYKDLGFLIAFLLHLIGMFILAGVHGPTMISDINNTTPTGINPPEEKQTADNTFIGLLVVAAVIGAVFSLAWLSVMKRFSTQIIHISLIASIALAALGVIAGFASGNPAMGVFFLITVAVICIYYYFVRARIPFATAILTSSVAAVQTHSGPLLVVYLLTLVQIAWLAFWAFTFAAVYHAGTKVYSEVDNGVLVQTRANNSSGLQFLQFYCVFSLYWTSQVIKNIGHTTTAGVVASWWFLPSVASPTKSSFVRATTTSIGSICFGSLLVALISTLRAMLRSARRDACRDIVDCLLGMVERSLKWFNTYAFCVVALYGESFLESAKHTGQIFQAQLFTALINDDLSGMVLFMGSFVSGAIAGIIGLLWAAAANAPGMIVMGILAFIVGFLVATLAMSVIASAVTTTFVCWACDPATLNHNRPTEFQRIIEAGQGKYAAQGLGQYSGVPQQQPMHQNI